ncbi:MAG: ATP-binding protein [Planctomycetota bacterium]|nr:ATP-binding protein [Planctomycetota bacterium]
MSSGTPAEPVRGSGVIHGHRTEIDAVQASIVAAMTQFGWDAEAQFALRLVVEEALVNSFVHGNQRNHASSIRIEWTIDTADIRLVIEDEGGGFEPECVPDPTMAENLDVPSGRGIVLMRAYMDEVSFNDLGNRVEMVKRRKTQ